MKTEHFFQKMSDGIEIAVNRWIPDSEIKGIVQLSHGMTEYAMRYESFGKILAAEGYVFNAHDHRGHGQTAVKAEQDGNGTFGYLGDKNGFNRVVDDVHELVSRVKTEYPGKKVILIGHSFGSFVAQSFIERYGTEIDSCILIGTAGPRLFLTRTGKAFISAAALICGRKTRSKAINSMTFGAYNNKIQSPVHSHDWLSRDAAQVEKCEADSFCTFIPTIWFFHDMLDGLCTIHTAANMKKIPKSLPVLFLYGDADPVGDYGVTVRRLYDIYKKNGMTSIDIKAYTGARHELLNETNKEEVIGDILVWIRKTAI